MAWLRYAIPSLGFGTWQLPEERVVAQVILRWHLDQGLIVIPRSKTPANIKANIDVFDFTLDEQDMAAIADLDQAANGRIGPKPTELGAVALPEQATPKA